MGPLVRRIACVLPLIAMGCSLIATSDAPQCATESDCYVKFGGGYACQSGGCVTTQTEPTKRVVAKLDTCRTTQECVASLGEGWLCRRDRDDPQKVGKCQQLTPTSECQVYGDYKNDQAVMLGALVPSKVSSGLRKRVEAGLKRAVADWEQATREIAATKTGADATTPPRPFAIVACSEDVPAADVRNLFLNTGVALVVGPSALRDGSTEGLSSELTNAKLVLFSPTVTSTPKEGANTTTYFFRLGISEDAFAQKIAELATKPTKVIRPPGMYKKLLDRLTSLSVPMTEVAYDASFSGVPTTTENILILADGEVADILPKVDTSGSIYVLPTAIEDLPPTPSATRTLRSFLAPRAAGVVTAFEAGHYGDAETYDAVYVALAALSAVPSTTSPDLVKQDELQKAILRVSSPTATTTFPANLASIRAIVKELRASTESVIALDGASGTLRIGSDLTPQTRALAGCSASSSGCK